MADEEKVEKVEKPKSGSKVPLIIALIVGVLVVAGGILFWNYSQQYESTDDAEIDGHLVGVAARIQGTVTAVYGEANQPVKAGQTMVEIDPRDYQVAAEQARAELLQAGADIQAQNPNIPITQTTSETTISAGQDVVASARADVSGAESDAAASEAKLREAEANNVKAQADVARYQALVNKDEVARQQYDQAVATGKAQQAMVESARASFEAARKQVEAKRAQLAEAESRLSQADSIAPRQVAISRATLASKEAGASVAQARLDKALLNLSYTKIVSPIDGVVSRRTVEVGATVSPGQQLFTVALINDLWVTANFKETQLRHMHPGQKTDIKVDAFGETLKGHVDSMPGATGAVMSLLPPENATGNYVKVVQRLPVRIRIEPNQDGLDRLRPGMSVEPRVWLQ